VEIEALVETTFLQNAQVFQTSIESEASTASLLAHLRHHALQTNLETNLQPFRLAVDRSFTVKGTGMVITGTVHTGSVKVEQQLTHYPSGNKIRIRGIRAQDKDVEKSSSGDRCALNITGIDHVNRGDWITEQAGNGYKNVTIKLETNKEFPRAIKNWIPIHVYHATSHSTGRLAALHSLEAGQLVADILCDESLACHQGDRVILRDQSLDLTIGGGKIIYADNDQSTRRHEPTRLKKLKAHSSEVAQLCLSELLAEGPTDLNAFQAFWNLKNDNFRGMLEENETKRVENIAISQQLWLNLKASTVNSLTLNPAKQSIKENNVPQVPQLFRQLLLNELVSEGLLEYVAGEYRLPGTKIDLSPPLAKLWETLEKSLDSKQPPSSGDLRKTMNVTQQELERDLNQLVKKGLLINVASHRYYLPKQLEAIANDIRLLAAKRDFSVREFRDHTNIGRNVAIDLLEFFDKKGFTRRHDNQRSVAGTYPPS
jgi:selenocysteine-specific elongation factor